ncbi:MAG TPA: glutamine-hydrolyzing carbamoyl-phosphate synthase small subunit [Gammaproteobacteria bacterium]|nr:carbamoyl-phosphate synthase small subunit [Chromatiales bacterium]MCP4925442.1 glutamine-hydrolyzing carbamoyl-phosphate synthase small subunit [Gammaproteobacteria bacterium]MDP7296759.1 glutamine-hydrolyzing carbamoyl-phosphate synthase small subunit [Gammaproteobacteria bacterium]MDP7660956.1 glutamine-hydrolyzing carbamoyl-phosphate synthase small subunit [Gammaproteobacteria bacterium]HJP38787.1 glutamine-hydrolyzing carbamoyl-phosphate synthase small subunit [Gammaproteobacteria bacte
MTEPAILALEDETVFRGVSIGATGQTIGEVVFNTSMTGYQEILTDPSYCRQMVTFTYPHIGNTGINSDDNESKKIFAAGLIIRDLPIVTSSWRAEIELSEFLRRGNVVAIAEIDTRKLTRILRDKGALSGCIMTGNADPATAVAHAKRFPGLAGMDLAKIVTAPNSYQWSLGPNWPAADVPLGKRGATFNVVAYDFGIKRNILRLLVMNNCRVTVVPAQTPAEKVLALSPDGVFLSNGPGDPEPCEYAINAIRSILAADIPVFGICLGHQLLALASGASTAKMKFGHHGANHPVQDLQTGRVAITSQNHGFAVDEASLPDNLRPTHRSLFDNSLQGISRTDCSAIGFQGHPEASPGPHDLLGIFDQFIAMMQAHRVQPVASPKAAHETG